jgi:hypothetical protein
VGASRGFPWLGSAVLVALAIASTVLADEDAPADVLDKVRLVYQGAEIVKSTKEMSKEGVLFLIDVRHVATAPDVQPWERRVVLSEAGEFREERTALDPRRLPPAVVDGLKGAKEDPGRVRAIKRALVLGATRRSDFEIQVEVASGEWRYYVVQVLLVRPSQTEWVQADNGAWVGRRTPPEFEQSPAREIPESESEWRWREEPWVLHDAGGQDSPGSPPRPEGLPDEAKAGETWMLVQIPAAYETRPFRLEVEPRRVLLADGSWRSVPSFGWGLEQVLVRPARSEWRRIPSGPESPSTGGN